MKLLFLPHFASGCLLASLGLLVYFKDRQAKINRLFTLLCLSITCWLWSFVVSQHTTSIPQFIIWERIGHVGVTFTQLIWLHLALAIGGLPGTAWRVLKIGYALFAMAMLACLIFTNHYFSQAVYTYWWGIYPQASFFVTLNASSMFLAMIASYVAFILAYQRARQRMAFAEYNRLKYICLP